MQRISHETLSHETPESHIVEYQEMRLRLVNIFPLERRLRVSTRSAGSETDETICMVAADLWEKVWGKESVRLTVCIHTGLPVSGVRIERVENSTRVTLSWPSLSKVFKKTALDRTAHDYSTLYWAVCNPNYY